MKRSQLFTKTSKDNPSDEISLNAQLLIRAGFVHKEMAGVYSFCLWVYELLRKISEIIKDEMNKIGGMQVKSTALQKQEVWEKTDRWSDEVVDNWFKTKLKNGTELGLAFTHEEAFSNLMKNYINSYKDLPAFPYDVRTMFRNELRSKSGLMRGREFYWKALYSFCKDEEQHNEFYEKSKIAYKNIFERVGLGEITYLTFASGGTFSKFSHEFQTISEAGEDIIYIDEEKNIAVNKEVYTDEVLAELGLEKDKLIEKKAIETGNIFTLGYKFSEPLGLTFTNEDGKNTPVFMGSYGLGITRLMGAIVEVFNDEKGIIWPKNIAPFQIYLAAIGKDDAVYEKAEEIYKNLTDAGIEVLYDDRRDKKTGPGQKFADHELLGIPARVVISPKTLEEGEIEFVDRRDLENTEMVKIDELKGFVEGFLKD